MRAPGYKPPSPGLRPDGMPNRAWRRQHSPDQVAQLTFQVFGRWMYVAARLVPGFVWEVDDGRADSEEATAA